MTHAWDVGYKHRSEPLLLGTEDLLHRALVDVYGEDRTIALLAALLNRMRRDDAEWVLAAAHIHREP